MSEYTFTKGRHNVHQLIAPYSLLVKAFGREGTVDPRDDYKQMAQWLLTSTPDGTEVEVYDYKVGKCYNPNGLERVDITDWHVQGSDVGIQYMLDLLDKV
jgi:hypothetical protein